MENKGTNITPLLEQIFGVSEINNKEDLEMLIVALREMGDEEIDIPRLAKIMEKMKSKKSSP